MIAFPRLFKQELWLNSNKRGFSFGAKASFDLNKSIDGAIKLYRYFIFQLFNF